MLLAESNLCSTPGSSVSSLCLPVSLASSRNSAKATSWCSLDPSLHPERIITLNLADPSHLLGLGVGCSRGAPESRRKLGIIQILKRTLVEGQLIGLANQHEPEAELLRVRVQSELYSDFKASPGYRVRACLKTQKNPQEKRRGPGAHCRAPSPGRTDRGVA